MKNAVEGTSLVVTRGDREVLHGLDLAIRAGEVTGLLGPSGCGKSTLMRALVGVQAGIRGTVTVLGEPAGSRPLRDRVGYVTQAPSVYDDLSVTENLAFFARVLGVDRAEVARCIDVVDLADHADQVVGSLSGGQRSRASLAVALLGSPELLVLDEPTVGLDPVLREDLWATFHRLARSKDDADDAAGGAAAGRAGCAVLVSSHVMDEAERCDRLLLMRDGVFIADGTPAEIKEKAGLPATADIEQAFLAIVRGETP